MPDTAHDEPVFASMRSVEYRILGPLTAVKDGESLVLGGRRQRMVLAVLLASSNHVVSRDALIESVWAGEAPDAAKATLHSYVSHLRAVLGDSLARQGDGYRVETDASTLDALLFEKLVDQGRSIASSDPEAALTLVQQGLDLWFGEPYGDLSGEPALAAEVSRLEELRLTAVEYRLEAELALGNHRRVIGELETLVRENPFRERMAEMQMLALYRSGRQADALRAYQKTRTILGEELGINPSPGLQELEQQILEQDPTLDIKIDAPFEDVLEPDGTDLEPVVGANVRGYELREQIGIGDYGVVYRAFQPSVGREAAIKFIRPEYVNRADFIRRFEAEAQVVAELEHPHIVTLLDFWRGPEGAYLVMPLLRGGSVADTLRRGPWDLAPVLRLLEQVGSAVSYAHRRGVIHRDIKAANVLLDDDGNAYLTDFGIATRQADRDGTPMTTSLAYLPPEEARGEPLTPRSDIFCLGVLVRHCLTGAPGPEGSNGHLSPELVEVLAKATDDQPVNRYERADDLLRAIRRAVGTDVVAIADVDQPPPQAASPRNPYKGLRAFTETDAIDFYGRATLVDELLRALASNRLLTVVGPSGSGKSSVVRAGLVPSLRSGGLPGSRGWLFTDMFPGSYPFEELGAALLRVAVDNPPDLVDELVADERGLLRICKQILPPDDTDLVLIIDQFEELFSSVASEGTRRLFLDALTTVISDDRSRVRLILTLRADFFDRPLEYPAFAEAMKNGIVTVSLPSEEGLAQAVSGPAKRVGVDLEPGLVNHVLRDVQGQPGSLPLLQYALTEIFSQRQGNLLTADLYRSTGGVLGALSRRADEIYDSLPPAGQAATEQIFLRLLTVDETAGTTRRRVLQSELKSLAIDQTALDQLLQQFGAFRLLTFDLHPVTRGPTVEVAHEALLTEWGTLRAWVDDRRSDLAIQRRINLASQEWTESEMDASYLLRGARLDQAEQWVEESGIAVSSDESRYLAASAALRQDEKSAGRRRRFRMLGAAAAGLIIVGALGALALRQSNQALVGQLATESVVALDTDPELAILLGLESANRALAAGAEVPAETMEALHNAVQVSRVEQRFDSGFGQIEASPNGELLATDNRGSGWVSNNEISVWNLGSETLSRSLPGPGEVIGLAWSPDGRRLAVAYLVGADDTPTFIIWGPTTGDELQRFPVPGSSWVSEFRVSRMAWSPDGSLLGATILEGTEGVIIWDTLSGQSVFSKPFPPDVDSPHFLDLAFLNDGTLLVARSNIDEVVFYDIATETEVDRLNTPFSPVRLAVDRQSNLLFAADEGGAVVAWKLDDQDDWSHWWTRPTEVDLGLTGGPALNVTDSGLVAVSGYDGKVTLLETEFGSNVGALAGDEGPVLDVTFSADGRRLHSVSTDGTARTWDVTQTGPPSVNRPLPHPERVIQIDVSADGAELAVQSLGGWFDLIDVVSGEARSLEDQALEIAGGAALSPDWQFLASVNSDDPEDPEDPEGGWVWSLSTFEELKELPACTGPKAFSPDGSALVLSACDDPSVRARVIDWKTGVELLDLGAANYLNEAKFNPGSTFEAGRYLATAGGSHVVSGAADIYDMTTGERIMGPVFPDTISVAFDPTGRYLAGGVSDGNAWVLDMVRLLEGNSPEDSLIFRKHVDDNAIWRVAINADGVLATTASDSLRLWDVFEGKMVAEPYVGTKFPPVSTFGPDGDYLLYGDTGLRTFYFEPEPLIELAETRVTRGLTPEECERYLGTACESAE